MTLADLNNQLSINLKQFIKSEGYIATGKLANSIKFKSTFRNNDLKIKLDALEYINYLDDGDLLTKFLSKQSTIDLIQQFYVENLVIDLDI